MHCPILVRFVAIALLGGATAVSAQTDEIQVYDGSLAEPGVFNLTLHNNYAVHGMSSSRPRGAEP